MMTSPAWVQASRKSIGVGASVILEGEEDDCEKTSMTRSAFCDSRTRGRADEEAACWSKGLTPRTSSNSIVQTMEAHWNVESMLVIGATTSGSMRSQSVFLVPSHPHAATRSVDDLRRRKIIEGSPRLTETPRGMSLSMGTTTYHVQPSSSTKSARDTRRSSSEFGGEHLQRFEVVPLKDPVNNHNHVDLRETQFTMNALE